MAKPAGTDISVLPEVVGFKFPCDGKEGQTRLKIINPSKEKQTFKVKLTRPERFRIGPPFGFVDPESYKMVRVKPNAFDGVKPLSKTDRFTVLLASAPPGDAKPADIWKHGSPLIPKNPKKCVVKILYCKDGEPVPPGATEDTKEAAKKPAAAPAPAAAKKAEKSTASSSEESSGGSSGESSNESSEESEESDAESDEEE